MTVSVGTEIICSHTIVPGHGRIIREKEHFSGLLAEVMRCNAQSETDSRPLFRMVGPEVEHRPLSVYEGFSGEVQL